MEEAICKLAFFLSSHLKVWLARTRTNKLSFNLFWWWLNRLNWITLSCYLEVSVKSYHFVDKSHHQRYSYGLKYYPTFLFSFHSILVPILWSGVVLIIRTLGLTWSTVGQGLKVFNHLGLAASCSLICLGYRGAPITTKISRNAKKPLELAVR